MVFYIFNKGAKGRGSIGEKNTIGRARERESKREREREREREGETH